MQLRVVASEQMEPVRMEPAMDMVMLSDSE
jgi:hypothetical protein